MVEAVNHMVSAVISSANLVLQPIIHSLHPHTLLIQSLLVEESQS